MYNNRREISSFIVLSLDREQNEHQTRPLNCPPTLYFSPQLPAWVASTGHSVWLMVRRMTRDASRSVSVDSGALCVQITSGTTQTHRLSADSSATRILQVTTTNILLIQSW